ncbi:MAG: hypothetical protein K9K37_11495 [Desulfocapsa sp.]|nr:hypothetical protein [Desulfocapsa sp.]
MEHPILKKYWVEVFAGIFIFCLFGWIAYIIVLGPIAVKGEIEQLVKSRDVKGLIAIIDRFDMLDMDSLAIEALQSIGNEEAIQGLTQLFINNKVYRESKAELALMLADFDAYEAITPIYNNISTGLDHITKRYVIALSRFQDKKAVDLIVAELSKTEQALQESGLRKAALIASLSVEEVYKGSPEYYAESDTWLRNAMIPAFVENSELISKDALKKAVYSDDKHVVSGAIWIATQLAIKSENPAIPDYLNDPILTIVKRKLGEQARNNWIAVKHVLFEEIRSGEYDRILKSLASIIGIGRKDALPELVTVLNQEGTKTMAEAYLNSGSGELKEAAEEWARKHGYKITTGPGYHPVNWGEWD